MRLHQRRLIDEPFHGLGRRSDRPTSHPPGTAERMLRIAQLKQGTKQLDELAWRLWWEGSQVEPDLIRGFLYKMASRWDDRRSEVRATVPAAHVQSDGESQANSERDILDEVFFQHLERSGSPRRGLGKDSDLYLDFSGLLVDLLRADFSFLGVAPFNLFAPCVGPLDEATVEDPARQVGRAAVRALKGASSLPYVDIVEALSSEQLERARPYALLFSRIIANIGEILREGYGGASRGRDVGGQSLVALSENPEEQVLSLLLVSSLIGGGDVRDNLGELESVIVHTPAISFRDYLRLRFLATAVPGFECLVTPNHIRQAFASPEGAQRWRKLVEQFCQLHASEIGAARASRPDLFGEEPQSDHPKKRSDDHDDKKKKLKMKS